VIPAALTRGDVATYVDALFLVYIILIFVNVLLSWIPRLPYNRWLRAAVDFVTETTNPYLNLFRRLIPPLGGGGFALDLSPMIGIILLFVVRAVVVGLIEGRRTGEPAPGPWPPASPPRSSPSTRSPRLRSRPAWCPASTSTCSVRSA
jgi:YggT family protein